MDAHAEVEFPFARELGEQHAAVRSTVKWLEIEIARSNRSGMPGEVAVTTLHVFRVQMGEHFRFEERGGFDTGFGSDDADVLRRTAELVRQHRSLESRLDAILASIARAAAALDF